MRLDQVGKRYGLRYPWVLRQVSLEIPAGRLVRFEGRNGSGKSTLLRIIAGVAEPSRGRVTGRPVTGYVPERFPPALPFPAKEYLAHLGRVHGLDGPDLRARIDECLDRLGGRELAPVPMRTMSKGMSQKVAVVQALLPGAGMLVLDEAWTGLDVQAKAALDEVIAERVAAGGSVVFVDHDPARLSGLDAQCWRLEDAAVVAAADEQSAAGQRAGEVSASAAGLPGAGVSAGLASDSSPVATTAAAAAAGLAAATGGVTVIELTGLAAAAAADASQQPGVLSVRRDGERVVIRAEGAAADGVLRRMLTTADGAHVVRVNAETADQPEGRRGEVPGRAGGPDGQGEPERRGVPDQ